MSRPVGRQAWDELFRWAKEQGHSRDCYDTDEDGPGKCNCAQIGVSVAWQHITDATQTPPAPTCSRTLEGEATHVVDAGAGGRGSMTERGAPDELS